MASTSRKVSRDIIVRLQFLAGTSEFNFAVINTRPKLSASSFKVPCNVNNDTEVTKFFESFADLLPATELKAIVFVTPGNEFESFIAGYIFRLKLRRHCEKHGIFCCFATPDALYMSDALCKTKTNVKEGEEVMFIRSTSDTTLEAMVVSRDQTCYRHVKTMDPVEYEFTLEWKRKFLDTLEPKKVIFFQASKYSMCYINSMKHIFKNEHPVAYFDENADALLNQLVVSKVMHEMGEKVNPYYVHIGLNNYNVHYNGEMQINIDLGCSLPVEESVIIPVFKTEHVVLSTDSPHHFSLIEKVRLATYRTKQVKVTVKVDVHSCYEFNVEPYDGIDLNEELPLMDNPQPSFMRSSSARIVFSEEKFYVRIVENDVEQIVETSDGLPDTPICISFTEAKPIIGRKAMELLKEKAEYVVSDLIKLCSISTVDEMDPKWKNRLIQEDESFMVTVQTFEGKVKANAQFFLAMILKDAIQLSRKETREKLDNFEIKFDDFSPNETLKKNFIEAAKLLKVDIVFG